MLANRILVMFIDLKRSCLSGRADIKPKTVIATIAMATTFIVATCQAHSIHVSGAEGTGNLIFANGTDGTYNSLYYETSKGGRLDIFDSGLTFEYVEGASRYLSPSRMYFFVSFSETGSIEDDVSAAVEHKEYLCAFVRMSDGCVVRVDSGEVCGGKWDIASQWIGLDGSGTEDLNTRQPTVIKVFGDYSSRIKDASVSSSPKIMKYLPEGTAFDNLLACDPVNSKNQKYYKNLLKLLWRDSNSIDAKKVIEAMKNN
jgi:hypothetical protein